MIHELRFYHSSVLGMKYLLERFEHDTLRLFEKHDHRLVGFWTVEFGPNRPRLAYLLEWDDWEHRERSTQAFTNDPEWREIMFRTEAEHGPLALETEITILRPTSFSPRR